MPGKCRSQSVLLFDSRGIAMKWSERWVTVGLSVVTTIGVLRGFDAVTARPVHGEPTEATSREELVVDRLVVRRELIVSDTGRPWEDGFESHQIPRGMVARSLAGTGDGEPGTAGIWVRGRLIKAEIDDPPDDRFHAIQRDGTIFKAPGHVSWNVWLDGAWRQLAVIQGEGVEFSEVPRDQWGGGNHPGRLRFQSFRPGHGEPLTDAVLGQGRMSVGGRGYGGGGLPYPGEVIDLWGGTVHTHPLKSPAPPRVIKDDGTRDHRYSLIAVGPQGVRSPPSAATPSRGRAELAWDSVAGADSYIVVRDGKEVPDVLRIEGSEKRWKDEAGDR